MGKNINKLLLLFICSSFLPICAKDYSFGAGTENRGYGAEDTIKETENSMDKNMDKKRWEKPVSTPTPSPKVTPRPTPTNTITPSPLTSAILYQNNCSGCHGTLTTSSKCGATAARIQSAIQNNVGGMGSLSGLSAAAIDAIATALK
ncbi:MAG TPA: cytochrome c [Desulfuromonadaceae bacterium]|jgi:hypothetical protein